jgi:Tfp pilus assembly protein PilZ
MAAPALKITVVHNKQSGTRREKRAAPRVAARIAVEVTIDGTRHPSFTTDLSATGAAVEYASPVELGQVFNLQFSLPNDGEEISCVGLVRSFRPSGTSDRIVGLEFHRLAPDKRRAIARYVAWVIAGNDLGAAADHWTGSDFGDASVLESDDRPVLRWAPGFPDLFLEVAGHVQDINQLFVPVANHNLSVGERLWFELVPPTSHVVLRATAEVTWVEEGTTEAGVGLRLAELTPMDRHVLKSIRVWFANERERYS